jgi:betaine lipid synthase
VKTISARNNMIPHLVKIPYYVWVGAQKREFPSMAAFSLDGERALSNREAVVKGVKPSSDVPAIVNNLTPDVSERIDVVSELLSDDDEFDAGLDAQPITIAAKTRNDFHVTNDHVHGQGYRWRQHFDASLISRFSTYLYAFTWEDPRVDLQFLDLKRDDTMFVISSGGCNVLEYAIKAGPKRYFFLFYSLIFLEFILLI